MNETAEYIVTTDVIDHRRSRSDRTGGCRESDASVRTLAVVMADVLSKHSLEVAMAKDEHPVEAFASDGSHPTLRVGIGSRRSNRGLNDLDALGAEHLIEAGRELCVPITDEELDGTTSISQVTDQIAGHLGNPGTDWMFGDTQDVDLSAGQFDHEEHVKLLEQDGVHGEEVGGQHGAGLGAKELGPCRSTPWHRSETILTQDPADRTCREADTNLAQLSLDANTAPASVFPTQTNDERNQFGTHRRPTRASLASPSPPLALGRFSMPSQQGLGGCQEGAPPAARQEPAECRENRPIRRSVLDTPVHLTFENPHLVAEHHELDVLIDIGSTDGADETEYAAQAEIQQGEDHVG